MTLGINDGNTLEDIQGAIYCAQIDLSAAAPEFPVAAQLDEIVLRIEIKSAKKMSQIRRNWFLTALGFAQQAKAAFEASDTKGCEGYLSKAGEYLEQGNKAHRRKTAFVVGEDGSIRHNVQPTAGKSNQTHED